MPCTEDLAPVYFGGVREIDVALVTSTMAGFNISAGQEIAKKAVSLMKPKAIICVGVCFGLLEKEQRLGDLLISRKTQRYSQVRVNKDGTLTPRSDRYLVNRKLFKFFKDEQSGWHSQLNGHRVKVYTGTILSVPELIDNVERRLQLKGMYPDAEGGEMEIEGKLKN